MEEIKAILLTPIAFVFLTFAFILAVVRGKRVFRVSLRLANMHFSLDNYPPSTCPQPGDRATDKLDEDESSESH